MLKNIGAVSKKISFSSTHISQAKRCPSSIRHLSVTSARVIKFEQNGNADQVLKVSEEALPNNLQPNQVLVKMLAAPINPMDINIAEGTYGAPGSKSSVTLPAVGGSEGVGVIVEVGSSVKGLSIKDRVIPAKQGLGTWRTYGVFESSDLQTVPSNLPTEYAATISINPTTAYRLLEDFAQLKSGDVIVQNGANSTVGISVIQLAKKRGIKTVNIVRGDRPDFDETVERLKGLGGHMVVSEQYLVSPAFKRLISDLPAPKLALNGVGGTTATEMIRLLGEGGTMVTYGGMSKKPFAVPTSHLIFKELQLKGFWLSRWYSQHSNEEKQKMLNSLYDSIGDGSLKLWIEKFNFDQFDQAIKKASSGFRGRKVLLNFEK